MSNSTTHSWDDPQCLQTLPNVCGQWGGEGWESALVENHCSRSIWHILGDVSVSARSQRLHHDGKHLHRTSTATKQGTAPRGRGQRRKALQDLCVCLIIEGAKVHPQYSKNVRSPCCHHPNRKSLRFFCMPSDHTEWKHSHSESF